MSEGAEQRPHPAGPAACYQRVGEQRGGERGGGVGGSERFGASGRGRPPPLGVIHGGRGLPRRSPPRRVLPEGGIRCYAAGAGEQAAAPPRRAAGPAGGRLRPRGGHRAENGWVRNGHGAHRIAPGAAPGYPPGHAQDDTVQSNSTGTGPGAPTRPGRGTAAATAAALAAGGPPRRERASPRRPANPSTPPEALRAEFDKAVAAREQGEWFIGDLARNPNLPPTSPPRWSTAAATGPCRISSPTWAAPSPSSSASRSEAECKDTVLFWCVLATHLVWGGVSP